MTTERAIIAILMAFILGVVFTATPVGGTVLTPIKGVVRPSASPGPAPVNLMNFQGELTDPGTGNPVADGSYSIRFSVWDAVAVGNEQWNETQSVSVSNGLFSVLLGSVTPLTASVFGESPRYLEIEIDPAGAMEVLSPRQQFVTVPYAFHAVNAWALDGNSGTSPGTNFLGTSDNNSLAIRTNGVERIRVSSGGNVGIGTISPAAALDINGNLHVRSPGGTDTLTLESATLLPSNQWRIDLRNVVEGDFNIRDVVNNAVRLYIKNDGRVGIGTTNPTTRLHVAGSAQIDGVLICTGCVGSTEIADGTITSADLAANAVTAAKVAFNYAGSASEGGIANDSQLLDGLDSLDFWLLGGNAGTIPGTDFLGTTDNQALQLHVNGARALRLEPNATSPNLIGGFSGNSVTGGVVGATIGGGGASLDLNTVSGHFGTVSGGGGNSATSFLATVGGGLTNTASNLASTVGGGEDNTASGEYATVGGGTLNTASGLRSTVGGGIANIASGTNSTVGGGQTNSTSGSRATVGGGAFNTAAGDYSFAAGRRAKINALHDGAFLFADQSNFNFNSAAANEFAVRSTGGARFVSAIDGGGVPTAGLTLAAGGNAWAAISDRNAKANFASVDGRQILERLASIPIESWNLKSQDDSIRHIGPMAQDFYAAFGVGEDDLHITTVDADGVALAAIQGLYDLVREQEAKIAALEGRPAGLEDADGTAAAAASPSSPDAPVSQTLLAGLGLLGLVLLTGVIWRGVLARARS